MTPEQAAAAAAWLAKEHPEWNQPAASAEAAAAQNAAWKANTLPVLPKFATPVAGTPGSESDLTRVYIGGTAETQGVARDLTRSEYIAMFGRTPEESESAKHEAAWQPVAFAKAHAAELADMSKSEIAARYGTGVADAVGDYYREHPSARYLAITGAYEYQQRNVVGPSGVMSQQAPSARNPYPEDSAAGIAWLVGRQQGGTVTESLAAKAVAEKQLFGDYGGLDFDTDRIVGGKAVAGIGVVSGMETIPVYREGEMQTIAGRTIYVPYGEQTQQELLDTKYIFDPVGGRIGIYQKPASIFEGEGFKRIYGIETASGSTGALQSGMFTLTPQSADIRTQWLPETYAGSADVAMAEEIRARPELYSRLGAEAYGGKVTLMDDRTLSTDTKMGRYPAEAGNLANIVDPYGVNRPKSELQATEPWSIEWSAAPVFQTMAGKGFGGTTVSPLPESELAKVGMRGGGRLVGGGMVGGTGTELAVGQQPVPVQQGFDIFAPITAVEERIRGVLPSLEIGERALKVGSYVNPFVGPMVIGSEITAGLAELTFGKESDLTKRARENVQTVYETSPATPAGQYEFFYEHPTSAALSFALGVGIGGAAGVAEKAYMAGRAGVAEKIITQGKQYRALEQIGGTVMSRAPQVLGGLYAADIGLRATEGGKEVTTASLGKARALVLQEAVPMGVGFGVPAKAVKTIQLSDIGYKQAVLEGEATGRVDYYLKQPVSELTRPIRSDYLAYVQEQTAKPVSDVVLQRIPAGVDLDLGLMTKTASQSALLYGSVANTNLPRVVAVGKTGKIVGAAAYKHGESLFVESIGSVQKGTGKAMVGELTSIAQEAKIPTISGEATSAAKGFWEKRGAVLTPGERPSIYPFEIKVAPKREVGVADYLKYKAERAYQLKVAQPIDVFEQELPGRVKAATEKVYGAYFDAKVRGILPYGGPKYAEPTRAFEYSKTGLAENIPYPEKVEAPLVAARRAAWDLRDYLSMQAKASGRASITPEISRPVYPEYATGGVYAEPAGEPFSLAEFVFKPRLTKLIPPTTFGETKVLPPLTTATVGRAGTEPVRKGPSSPDVGRKIVKTPYGYGLAKEPSLKSMGITEPKVSAKTGVEPTTKTIGQRVDYRGRPASQRMKPMDTSRVKQAQGSALLTEELPKVEGMTRTPQRVEPRGFPRVGMLPKTGVVQVIEPEIEFGVESETRRETLVGVSLAPALATVQMQRNRQTTVQEPISVQRSREEMFVPEVSRRAREDILMKSPVSACVSEYEERMMEGIDTRTTIVPRVSTSFKQTVGTRQDITQQQKTRQITTQDTVLWPGETITTIPKPPALPFLGAGGAGGGYRKGAFRFVETLGFEMSRGRKGAFLSKKKKSQWGRF